MDYWGGGGGVRFLLCIEKHQLNESIRHSSAFFFLLKLLLIIAVESVPVSVGFSGSESEDLRVETT